MLVLHKLLLLFSTHTWFTVYNHTPDSTICIWINNEWVFIQEWYYPGTLDSFIQWSWRHNMDKNMNCFHNQTEFRLSYIMPGGLFIWNHPEGNVCLPLRDATRLRGSGIDFGCSFTLHECLNRQEQEWSLCETHSLLSNQLSRGHVHRGHM